MGRCAAAGCTGPRGTTSTLYYQLDGGSTKPISPATRANVQVVLDMATPTRKLFIQQSVGNLDADSTLWIHGNTFWFGQGKGLSTITRTRFNAGRSALPRRPHQLRAMGDAHAEPRAHGNVPTDSLANITIEGVTLDGSYTSWPSVDPNSCNNFGMQFWFTDNLTIRDVEVKNTLQTGIELDACRNSKVLDSWIHDVASSSTSAPGTGSTSTTTRTSGGEQPVGPGSHSGQPDDRQSPGLDDRLRQRVRRVDLEHPRLL
jgi:hypothetical protein